MAGAFSDQKPSGIFDMSGNLWEWTDGNTLDFVVVVGNSAQDLGSADPFLNQTQLITPVKLISMLCQCP